MQANEIDKETVHSDVSGVVVVYEVAQEMCLINHN